jgi:very-short-patch-repair endonuclease/predicted transcriptional regulator of viral defense system
MRSTYLYGQSGDTRLAELATRQHGVVSTRQLREVGYSDRMIHVRVTKGALHRLHRGVYAVGHTKLTARGRWMAAVLACGPDALLSHRAAAALWDIRPIPSGAVDVTATTRHNLPGIRCHLARAIHPDDRAVIDGIPVTSLARVYLDLAARLSHQRLRSTLEAAQHREILDGHHVTALLQRSSGHRGAARLAAALAELYDFAPWTQSEPETRLLEAVRAAGLPEPRANILLKGELVDFYWPEHNLVVEVDGYRFHNTKRSFEDNRRRDTKLQVAGIRVVRVTRQRVVHDTAAVIRDIAALLDAAKPLRHSG